MPWRRMPFGVCCLCLLLAGPAAAQTLFTQVTEEAGIQPVAGSRAALFWDYDLDGHLDLFVPVGAYLSDQADQNILLRNDRGVFHDVALEAGLIDSLPTDNALWFDYDRDGYLDLYTGNPGCGTSEQPIFNLVGQRVAALVEGKWEAGQYTITWDGRDGRGRELASGVYLYRLRAGERMETRKLVLVQ